MFGLNLKFALLLFEYIDLYLFGLKFVKEIITS